MVRVWNVPAAYLDDKRLLGEHLEIHIIINAIIKTHQGKKAGWAKHPETLKYLFHAKSLLKRHDKLVEEMRKRGWKGGKTHETPLLINKIPRKAMKERKPTKQEIRKDIADLKKRWKKEGKKGGRLPISELEKKITNKFINVKLLFN